MFILADPPYDIIAGCSFPGMVSVPKVFGDIISIIYMTIRVGVPIILLLAGMIDLVKAIMAQKPEEIKKAQGLLMKKIVTAVIIFTIFTLVQFTIDLVDKNNSSNSSMWACVNALLGNKES